MNEFRDLFGGFAGAVAVVAFYIFAWSAVTNCFGEEYPNPQPVLIGDLQPAEHPQYIPQSGDEVVVNDMAFVLISSGDWQRWTNAVARLEAVAERRWKKEHETAEGRRAWHGNPKREVSADGRTVLWNYPDGYIYTEEVKAAPRRSPAVLRQTAPPRPQNAPKRPAGNGLPPRLRAKREAIEARPAVREVNATFGVGGKVLNVEGGK